MGGWFLDEIIGYLIRTLAYAIRAHRSDHWITQKATVHRTASEYAYGGVVGEVCYTYTHRGEYYSGVYRKPFWLYSSAKDYVARFPAGMQLLIKVNPDRPEISFCADRNQGVRAREAAVL